jgi:2-succinyl-6-hydroxy-2,4-cyclohexadiene-1-carboxylate synthase
MDINGVGYHVEIQGSGDPVLFLHGFTGSGFSWEPITSPLSENYRTIAPDLLGHGRTASPIDSQRYSMEAAAQDLADILKGLSAVPAHVVGYSMGGRLALYLAIFYPEVVRSLTLESASPGLASADEREKRRQSDNALADEIERSGINAFVEKWEKRQLFATQNRLPSEILAKEREIRLGHSAGGLANSLRGMGTGAQPSLWDELGKLSCPVLILAGALDTKFSGIAEAMVVRIPGAILSIVPEAGHNIHLEQEAIYLKRLKDFLGG